MTIRELLDGANFTPWVAFSVRRRLENDIEYLGGGHVERILRRFGDMVIENTTIVDGALVIHVK